MLIFRHLFFLCSNRKLNHHSNFVVTCNPREQSNIEFNTRTYDVLTARHVCFPGYSTSDPLDVKCDAGRTLLPRTPMCSGKCETGRALQKKIPPTVLTKSRFPPRNRQNTFFLSMQVKSFLHQCISPKKFWIFIILGKFWTCFGAETYFFWALYVFHCSIEEQLNRNGNILFNTI